jgi:hypothetical protein
MGYDIGVFLLVITLLWISTLHFMYIHGFFYKQVSKFWKLNNH